jgi:signal transduction histidine kinase/ligand-binding sensor domain-containing protein
MESLTVLGRSVATVVAAALAGPCALALNPSLDISQYAHNTWSLDKGFLKGAVHSIAQTPDGFLWLGTEFGLVRFDGVKAVEWPINQSLPSTQIRSLMAGRDGTLWLGTSRGLVSIKEGGPDSRSYPEFEGETVFALAEDRAGNVWAGGWSPTKATLCAVGNVCAPIDRRGAALGSVIGTAYRDGKDNIWVGTSVGVWRWNPAPPEFYPLPGESGFDALAEDGDGRLLVATKGAIQRLVDGHVEMFSRLPAVTREFHVRSMLRDREGGLWVGTTGRGLVHIHQGRTEMFTRNDGLSGDDVTAIFEDRDGNIWVGSFNGLDRFSETPVQTYTERDGLWSSRVVSVLAARDGSIWMRTLDGLSRLKNQMVTVYRENSNSLAPGTPGRGANTSTGNGFQGQGAGSLFEDAKGRVWVSTLNAVRYFSTGRFVTARGIPGGRVHSIVGDAAGNVWVAHQDRGLLRWQEDGTVQQTSWSELGQKGFADALAVDPLKGGIWVGFFGGGLLYFQDGHVVKSYHSTDRTAETRVNDFRIESDGTLWITTEGGLSRLKDGRLVTLTTRNGLLCDRIHWTIEDNLHSVWIYTACGLLRVSRSELDACAAAIEKDKNTPAKIHPMVFDSSDGLRARANAGGFSPHVTKSPDGRLWFFPLDGLSSIDPARIPLDSSPPPVHIETLTADRLIHSISADPKDRLVLQPLVRDLEIEYTALSFAAPEKLRFRYKLEGRDRDWVDAGTRRQAFYNDLAPRTYRFRVMASKTDGVWKEAGVALDFSIAPAYYQTIWFVSLIVATVLASLAALYQVRLRYLKHQFNIRLEARVGERTRIARELHDTLLQSFQGVLMKFSGVKYVMRSRPGEVEETLDRLLDQARAAITEGRDAVQGLRSSTVMANDLAFAITSFAEGLAVDHAGSDCPVFRVFVDGKSRDLPPLVRDEVYKIACESLRNAFRHAQARRIEVQIRYEPRQFRLQLVDDGKGIDPTVLSAGGRAGHHGLPGMYERAELAGGKLTILGRPGSGTKIELTIPASIAYAKSLPPGRAMFPGKERG